MHLNSISYALSIQLIREFGIRAICYANYHVAQVGEIDIRLLSNLAQENIVSYPKFT